MGLDIYAGKRVLYKDGNSSWRVGRILKKQADVNEKGVWIPVCPTELMRLEDDELPYVQYAEINNIFTEAIELQDWMKENLIPKASYVELTKKEGFEKHLENAWFSDGEYYYYPVSKFTEGWIMKQPFDYVIRSY